MFLEQTYHIEELIKRCKAGERKAQELLYKQFASKMLGVCFRYATDKMEAEDMLQNGFIKVFQKLADYRGEKRGCDRRLTHFRSEGCGGEGKVTGPTYQLH